MILKKRYRILLLFLLLSLMVTVPFLYLIYFPDFLLMEKKVEANVLLAEGWLRYPELWAVNKEFQKGEYDYLITTGQKYHDYFKMNVNGYLIFYIRKDSLKMEEDQIHEIAVYAESSLAQGVPAHFNLIVNRDIIADYFVDNDRNIFKSTWKGNLSDMDSVIVHFDNDAYIRGEDRNLFIKGISVDDRFFSVYTGNVEYDINKLDGKQRLVSLPGSYAEMAKESLINMGIDSARIISVPGNEANLLRTYYSAVSLKRWLDNSGMEINGINIVSRGIHTRRTWITYSTILDLPGRIGIMALPDPFKPGLHMARRYLLYETIGYLYYRFILLPCHVIRTGWKDLVKS